MNAKRSRPRDEEDDEDTSLPRMTLGEHLDELRRRLVRASLVLGIGVLVAFFYNADLFRFIKAPYDRALEETNSTALGGMQGLAPTDGFMSSMKLAFIAALVVTSPWILAQLWGFVAAGLYPRERRGVRIFFPISVGLFALGCAFAYLIVLPVGMRFLIRWNAHLGLASTFGVGQYLSLCLALLFGLGLAFELPLLMLFLQATGIVERGTFSKHWRIAVLTAFVLAMILTPDTSPVSMTVVAIPLVALFFIGVWGGRFVGDDKIPFRIWHVWPMLLLAAAMGALFWYRAQIYHWASTLFS